MIHSRANALACPCLPRVLFYVFLHLALVMMVAAAAVAQSGDGDSPSTDDAELQKAALRETITITANRIETPAEKVGSSLSVLEHEEIEALGKATLGEVLRTLPGLEVVRGGPSGQVTSVFIRGGSSSHTLVLLDGVRANSSTTGALDFADLSADLIERIEVLRGPQSTLYGSEAMAGVVSVTTRSGEEGFQLDGLGEFGEEGRHRFRLGINGGSGPFDYALSLSDLKEDGFSAASEQRGNREDDPHENSTVAGRFGLEVGEGGRLDLTVRRFSGEVAVDGFDFTTGGPVDNLVATNERENLTTGLSYRQSVGDRWRQSFTLGYSDDELIGREPGGFGNFTIDSRSFEIGSQTDFEAREGQTYTFGYNYEEREGGSVGSFDETSRLSSFYLQGAWTVGERLFLTAGGRRDDHSTFGGETTYRGTLAWLFPDSGLRLHGSIGTGFKAPTLNDLFFPGFSNPNLRPETSEGYDLGLELTRLGGRLVVDVTAFRLDFDDLIAFDFVTFTPQNLAKASSEGLELSLTYRPSETWGLAFSHTHNETEDGNGRQLARRPERRSTLRLDFRPWSQLRGSFTLVAVGDRVDSNASVMDDYERLDLALRYAVSKALELTLRVENLGDEEYEELIGFTSPGAVAALGLAFRL